MTDTQEMIDGTVKNPVNALVERLARQVGGMATASAIYGAPVEREGVTVIPVAAVRWGFGGGGGSSQADVLNGGGGGGGVIATPIGYIELRNGTAAFHPIRVPASLLLMLPLMLAGGFNCWLILRGLRKLLHR